MGKLWEIFKNSSKNHVEDAICNILQDGIKRVKSGNSNCSYEGLIAICEAINRIAIPAEVMDRRYAIEYLECSETEFNRLIDCGAFIKHKPILKAKDYPGLSRKVYYKADLDDLLAAGLVKTKRKYVRKDELPIPNQTEDKED